MWMRIADELHCTRWEAMERCSSSDFWDYVAYFDLKAEERAKNIEKIEVYLAQISVDICNAFRGKDDPPMELKDRIQKFSTTKTSDTRSEVVTHRTKDRKPNRREVKQRTANSKRFWLTGLGLKAKDGTPHEKLKTKKPPTKEEIARKQAEARKAMEAARKAT